MGGWDPHLWNEFKRRSRMQNCRERMSEVGSRDGVVSGCCIMDKSNKLPEPAKSAHLYDNFCSSIVYSADCGMITGDSCKGGVWRHQEGYGQFMIIYTIILLKSVCLSVCRC